MPYALASDQTAIHYQVHGEGAPTLLLLAGQANSRHWWDPVLEDFSAVFRTVTLDYRGTGCSAKPDTDSYSTRGFAEDVRAVLDHLGAARAHVYGTSMGGRVAQWFAVDHPDRLDRLVLGCTSPGDAHGVPRDPAITEQLTRPGGLAELMYSPDWLATHPGPHSTLGDPGMPGYARRRHRFASARHDSWAVLDQIAAPTLILHGTEDVFNPAANAKLLAERIPRARLELIEGARHAYFEEFRARASRLVLDFLAESPGI
ncbi:alpha/beta fold hydrolase [Sciscionella sediminilitoris]|uniref:alpha/beta fold hydrolase n=1 Tax=Sciscionella sediminilitoris TaxID=1445613 RepID=UPI0004DF514B|nr:alpha/beta fold hydrolase [Sciscionella sp. SE31]